MSDSTDGPRTAATTEGTAAAMPHHDITNRIVRTFLDSHLSIILILIAVIGGAAALLVTPREEDPQIVVPLADVFVRYPGHGAGDVEQHVTTPLEKLLYQIDGVEYVYSMSRENEAIITVRFHVGQDRERSLVKLYKRIDEHIDIVPPGVDGWVVKPVEIDDVPIVTLALASDVSDELVLRRVAEEVVERLAAVPGLSRAYIVGGQPRQVRVRLDPDRMKAHRTSPLDVERALRAANVTLPSGTFTRRDESIAVDAGRAFLRADELAGLVVAVHAGRPVFLKDVADVIDGAAEADAYVRHGWGPAAGFPGPADAAGAALGPLSAAPRASAESRPAVAIAFAKQKGTNAVTVARNVLSAAASLKHSVIPDDVDVVITRNYGRTANDKVNELVEALAVAVFIVIALLSLGLGWRESLIVAVAVPVVFGLTLVVNYLLGFTINRVTLFAMILALGLLVDDPIVDVENITRHFSLRRRASKDIVLEAVAEIRPPLITATLAVIVSFLPMFFITGMMGPYMRPMAFNVPVTMVMSMLVAFTITPWMSYHVLRRGYSNTSANSRAGDAAHAGIDDPEAVKHSALYRFFYPLMAPLLTSRRRAWLFLGVMLLLTLAAAGLAATRHVPLKMLPFDNKNELQLVLDFDESTTLERTDAAVRAFEDYLRAVPEVTDFTACVGHASPMDFNGMVRHYYLRRGPHVADIRVNLVGKKARRQQSHALGLRIREDLQKIAIAWQCRLKIVETPPGPPVIASIVAEVYGRPDHAYADLMTASRVVRARLEREPGVADVDDTIEAPLEKLEFVVDKEKAALAGVSTDDVARTLSLALGGARAGTVRAVGERRPLAVELRLPRALRSSAEDLARLHVGGRGGAMVALAELGRWETARVDQTIYHKNLRPVVYVFAETAGRPPADCVVDIQADRMDANDKALMPRSDDRVNAPVGHQPRFDPVGSGAIARGAPRPVDDRSFLSNGGHIGWRVPDGIEIDFAGEGEWKITLDVFRDLGIAFAAALAGIYVLLVAQTGSFVIPGVVMLAIPLTVLGIMPGFWLLNAVAADRVGGYADPVFFTATGMIGMIALAGIVTRDSIILVDFIHLSLARGRTVFDAIMESRVVRLRPILLTAGTALLSAAPITIDPIFSGLAWSLIFGLLASTVFTLFVIPVTYWLLYAHRPRAALGRVD